MARPTLPPGVKRAKTQARMNAEERARADRLALLWGCSRNEAINRAIALALELAEASEHP